MQQANLLEKNLAENLVKCLTEQGYAVVTNALQEDLIQSLSNEFDKRIGADVFQPAKIGKDQKQVNQNIRSDRISWLEEINEETNEETNGFYKLANEIINELNQKLYLGLKSSEFHFAEYAPGSKYETHIDTGKHSSRKISSVLYLNKNWEKDDGGELVLYSSIRQSSGSILHEEKLRLLPTWNTWAFFLSEEFPHEVLPAKRTRRSLTGWFHSSPIRTQIL